MITLKVYENHSAIDTLQINGNEILQGSIPDFLERSIDQFKKQGKTAEDYIRYHVNTMSNAMAIDSGNGMVMIEQPSPQVQSPSPALGEGLG